MKVSDFYDDDLGKGGMLADMDDEGVSEISKLRDAVKYLKERISHLKFTFFSFIFAMFCFLTFSQGTKMILPVIGSLIGAGVLSGLTGIFFEDIFTDPRASLKLKIFFILLDCATIALVVFAMLFGHANYEI